MVVRASETRPNCSQDVRFQETRGRELSGPQKPGPIAASWRSRGRAERGRVVRASETRPNCSWTMRLLPNIAITGCPGLRNPAQLQPFRRRCRRRSCGRVVRASETRPNCSVDRRDVAQEVNEVVRASETRPNCSGEDDQGFLLGLRCPGLRNPAQLQPSGRPR